MPRFMSGAVDWAIIVIAFGFLAFILLSPTGSFVRSPMEHTRQVIDARDDGGLLSVHASPVEGQGRAAAGGN